MKTELCFVDGKLMLKVTEVRTGTVKLFGPYGFTEGEALLRNPDACRALFLSA